MWGQHLQRGRRQGRMFWGRMGEKGSGLRGMGLGLDIWGGVDLVRMRRRFL